MAPSEPPSLQNEFPDTRRISLEILAPPVYSLDDFRLFTTKTYFERSNRMQPFRGRPGNRPPLPYQRLKPFCDEQGKHEVRIFSSSSDRVELFSRTKTRKHSLGGHQAHPVSHQTSEKRCNVLCKPAA